MVIPHPSARIGSAHVGSGVHDDEHIGRVVKPSTQLRSPYREVEIAKG